ncbi:unnamed protein product [Auanema sp. JU1783]|nr:unnamed protein product [Auanema sp. JU1783]
MFPNGSGFVPGPGKKGARIALEPYGDWKIQEIGYDGVEKYLRPESFSDHVGKLACKVDWKQVVPSALTYDDPNAVEDEEDEEETQALVGSKDRLIPEAGPWHTVAKNLHESLTQLHVLLDDLKIMSNTNYMAPLTILDPIHNESGDKSMDNKALQWIWRRKALLEAASVLEKAHERLSQPTQTSNVMDNFFLELKKMREYWRVRKTGDHIYGDLGYHIFGPKYNSRELFDITRRSTPILYYERGLAMYTGSSPTKDDVISSVLQVSVPRDLTRRSTLSLSIVRDDASSQNLFANLDDSNFEWMKIETKKIENIHWSNALKWAQDTLICRDTFDTLCTESVQMRERRSTIRDGVLLVALHDGYMLRIELKYYPFVDGEFEAEGDSYLNRSLRQMIVAKECTRWIRPQLYVSLPPTQLPETLDVRGPRAFTQREIEACAYKPEFLLEKLIQVSSHYNLIKIAIDTLKEFIQTTPDPQVQWRFLRCTPTHSQLIVVMSNRNFDYIMGKTTYYMQISPDSITIVNKEGQSILCYRDKTLLLNTLKFMLCTFSLNTISGLARSWWYQVLHANMNAVDENGDPAPSLYMCSYGAEWQILIQFPVRGQPVVKIRKSVVTPSENPDDDKFTVLNYKRIPGSTLCKKLDNLLEDLLSHDILVYGSPVFVKFLKSNKFENSSGVMKTLVFLLCLISIHKVCAECTCNPDPGKCCTSAPGEPECCSLHVKATLDQGGFDKVPSRLPFRNDVVDDLPSLSLPP